MLLPSSSKTDPKRRDRSFSRFCTSEKCDRLFPPRFFSRFVILPKMATLTVRRWQKEALETVDKMINKHNPSPFSPEGQVKYTDSRVEFLSTVSWPFPLHALWDRPFVAFVPQTKARCAHYFVSGKKAAMPHLIGSLILDLPYLLGVRDPEKGRSHTIRGKRSGKKTEYLLLRVIRIEIPEHERSIMKLSPPWTHMNN